MAWASWQVASLLGTVLVAGCAGTVPVAPAPLAAGEAPIYPSTIDLGSGSGSILGYVMDTELRGVPEATVQVRRADAPMETPPLANLTTDGDGRFHLRGLDAGRHLVIVHRAGFDPREPVIVQVEAEQEAEVQIILVESPTAVPFTATKFLRAISSGYCTFYNPETLPVRISVQGCTYVRNNAFDPTDRTVYPSEYVFENNETQEILLQTILIEGKWQPSQQTCKFGMDISLYSPQYGSSSIPAAEQRPFWWSTPTTPTSPLALRVDREGVNATAMHSANRTEMNKGVPIETAGKWKATGLVTGYPNLGQAADFSCWYNQWYDLVITNFYVRPAAAGFSAFPDE